MHELTICDSLIGMLAEERRRRGFRTVTRLRIEIGTLSCLDPEALRFAFDVSTRETFLHGTVLEIDRPPGRATCLDCGADVAVSSRLDACPHCGGVRLDPHGGDQLRLIEMEIL
ncbi:hydrogenase maturation nickel metallochaperone HypA [Rhodoplanes elegans]|uniref:Hydrogenase maturation factor HypA n=1 Tax=Rhodoplanes elegans TaxID=29408 RepID=A0A327L1N8_9BRAD|nr:hydrogenase maturation nickel metallochaperone HypA [Rhodoplanes elegans]MBK5958600.1 hydrogenase maturation nickel metallochaperone HypA [Rhodoplanes elegans]RAI41618.1 hydrogenase maturation nickel metallochaperone HypA [Rhodoplanes elegans]